MKDEQISSGKKRKEKVIESESIHRKTKERRESDSAIELNRSMVEIVYPKHEAWVSHHNVVVRFNLESVSDNVAASPKIFVDGIFRPLREMIGGYATIDLNEQNLC